MSLLRKWTESKISLDSDYLKSTDDDCKTYIDSFNHSVMHEWERPIMFEDARMVTRFGGKILNIGHGMGIIDSYIRDTNPEEHTIVDIHPQIVQKARDAGYSDVWEGDWLDFVKECVESGRKFNGIYFDTYCFDRPDWAIFALRVDSILEPGGTFVYFNGGAASSQRIDDVLGLYGWSNDKHMYKYDKIENGKTEAGVWTSIGWVKPIK